VDARTDLGKIAAVKSRSDDKFAWWGEASDEPFAVVVASSLPAVPKLQSEGWWLEEIGAQRQRCIGSRGRSPHQTEQHLFSSLCSKRLRPCSPKQSGLVLPEINPEFL